MKIIYKFIGIMSLLIGVLGVFIPLLPTTCFVLLSAWCFSKSSPRWHQALRENRLIGESLVHWEDNRKIPIKAQRFAIASILFSGIYSIVSFDHIVIKLTILCIASISIWALYQLKTVEKAPAY